MRGPVCPGPALHKVTRIPTVPSSPRRSLLPKSATYYFAAWRDDGTDEIIHELLRCQVRERARRSEDPTLVVLDTQSVHVAAGVPASTTGRDPAKRVPGRKRGLAVDVLGLVIAVTVLAANTHDNAAGIALLDQVAEHAGATVRTALRLPRLLGNDPRHAPPPHRSQRSHLARPADGGRMNLQPLLDALDVQEGAAQALVDDLRTQIVQLQGRLQEAETHLEHLATTRKTVTALADRVPTQAASPELPEHPNHPRILAVFNEVTGPSGPATSAKPSTTNWAWCRLG